MCRAGGVPRRASGRAGSSGSAQTPRSTQARRCSRALEERKLRDPEVGADATEEGQGADGEHVRDGGRVVQQTRVEVELRRSGEARDALEGGGEEERRKHHRFSQAFLWAAAARDAQPANGTSFSGLNHVL